MNSVKRLFLLLTVITTFFLLRCSLPQDSTPFPVTITADSTIAVRDTLRLHFLADNGEEVTGWYIQHEDRWGTDSTTNAVYELVHEFPDTGRHRLMVHGVRSNGDVSVIDTVTYRVTCSAPTAAIAGDSVVYVNDTTRFAVTTGDDDGTVTRLLLSDGSGTQRLLPADTLLYLQWDRGDTGVREVELTAIDNDGLYSSPATKTVTVTAGRPAIVLLTGDTVVSVNDTAVLVCTAQDPNGEIRSCSWMLGDGALETVIDGGTTLRWKWHLPDTGLQIVRVQALDDDGLRSEMDSILVRVTAYAPAVATIIIGQNIVGSDARVTARASDADGEVVAYQWTVATAEGLIHTTTADSILPYTWKSSDVGSRVVYVVAVDEDSLHSPVKECMVMVYTDFPELSPVADTVLSADDTLTVIRATVDSTQEVERWFHDLNADGWDDSTTTGLYPVFYTGTPEVTVVTGVRNSSGAFYMDTFVVRFNRIPQLVWPQFKGNDTLWVSESIAVPGTCSVSLRIDDDDGDFKMFQLLWDGDTVHTTSVALDDTVRLPFDRLGSHTWSYTLSDVFGNVVQQSGETVVGIEHTICFAGHSIAVGVGDTTLQGGFRPMVLASLRDSTSLYERIRPVGLFSTDQVLMNRADDSCFAISGSFAREMLLLMDQAHTGFTADVWVVMLGVNAGFSGVETDATISLLNRMVSRNPDARVYVLTSQPHVSYSEIQRTYYNSHIRSAVTSMQSEGYNAFVVETGDSVLKDTLGKFDTSLAFDVTHPNIFGYRKMADEIIRVMWEMDTPVVDVYKPQE